MRTFVDAFLLLGIHLVYWSLDTVTAIGGALDSSLTFQTGASSTSHSKTFSASLSDGLAQAVAHESSKLSKTHWREREKKKNYQIHVLINLFPATDTCNDDLACITMASHDRLGLEAIKSLHSQLDDDANGNVDLSESDDVCTFVYCFFINTYCILRT